MRPTVWRIEQDLHAVLAAAERRKGRQDCVAVSLILSKHLMGGSADLSSTSPKGSRKRAGWHPIDLFEFSSEVSLIAEVQHERDVADRKALGNQLPGLRHAYLTHIGLRCHAHRSAEGPDEMALVHAHFPRERLGPHCTRAVLPDQHTGSARERAGAFVRGTSRESAS